MVLARAGKPQACHSLFTVLRWYPSWTSVTLEADMMLMAIVISLGVADSPTGAPCDAGPVTPASFADNQTQTGPPPPPGEELDRVDQDGNQKRDDPDAKEPPTPPHTGVRALLEGTLKDFEHLPSAPNAMITVAGTGAAFAVHPLDDNVNAKLRGHEDAASPAFALGKWIGQTPVQVGVALGVYTYGRTRHADKVSHFGMDLLRAQIVTGVLTTGLKYATQRERPDHSNDHSFPSGHASVTFATATVIERHLGWKMSAVGYSVAAYVASSRLHDNRHWLSDVVFGAAVGTIGGRTVTQHGRNSWTLVPTSVPGGVAVLAARTR
jgi:hypothetical protein